MEYRVYGQDVVVRMDRGEEILDCIRQVCEKEHILLAPSPGSRDRGSDPGRFQPGKVYL